MSISAGSIQSASLTGQSFLKTRGGDVKKGAGNYIFLMPATSFGHQRFEQEFVKGIHASPVPDNRHFRAIRHTISDGEGRFEFNDLPPGKYYVYTSVTWDVPTSFGWMSQQGGLIYKLIEIKNSTHNKVVLTWVS